ncbi:UbiD family decarboxylase [Desulfosporosinus orientis DSM 765]|uniref:UbiD family decarboxylase n=1 Tax=Desulfosporosinus orientis (strain ATCC 19365 / DSM 765 / NCIMB 8382 / VKM B-1628 / Singapore I) TaxID=768706 RepID=G7WFU9_DESOD|nr:UbiD family decarboxylase [Desulfosporosinus orientis]AET69464.1 UbiD family decarboxylase [Desulfosporosinus orientis DSM 765]
MEQDLRGFIERVKQQNPLEVVHVREEIDSKYEISTLIMELEKARCYPLTIFDNVKGHDISVVTNVLAPRERLALGMGVHPHNLASEFSKRINQRIEPVEIQEAPFRDNVFLGSEVDLYKLPILTHFPIDAGPYITAGLVIAKDPLTGADTAGYHRMQLKGRDKLGISLHSRQRLWEYFRRSEELGKSLEAAIVLGIHPNISMGSMALVPYDLGKFAAMGGLFGAPLEIARCNTIDLCVPAYAEVVIEGEIVAGEREAEGPFAEFTNYACYRSTENIFKVKGIQYRTKPLFQDITPGMSSEHITIVAVQREGDVLNALNRTLPNIRSVHAPVSACGLFHCYISMKKIAEGQAQQAIFTAFSVDHNLKMVVVVDEDVDVFDERQVLWAMATRLQADKGVTIVPQHMGMGCTLDPSTDELSRTAKMGIDATKPLEGFAPTVEMSSEVQQSIQRFMGSFGL